MTLTSSDLTITVQLNAYINQDSVFSSCTLAHVPQSISPIEVRNVPVPASTSGMASTGKDNDFSHLTDVLGSLPMIKRYVVICLCFSLNETHSASAVERDLKDALSRLASAFPYLAGQVVYENRDESHTGIRKIVPFEDRIQLHINDLREDSRLPSMTEMSKSKFPFSTQEGDTLLPPIAVSWASDGYDKVAPVLILQANLIKGGVLLTFSGNHTTMDMTGLGMIISLLSKACRNEPYTEEEIKQGNQSRQNAIPLLAEDYEPGDELDDSFVQPPNQQALQATLASDPQWAYFTFRAKDLSRLKQEASQQSVVPYISTDDAMAAFCWQRITQARLPNLGPHTRTTFCRTVSTRTHFDLKGYLGHMVDCAYESEVDVQDRPLGEISGRLRRLLLQNDKIKHHMQAFATVLDRLDDKSTLINGAKLDPMKDVVVSSYGNSKCCELSFGKTLGVPEAARRPRMPAWPSLVYLMPKDRNGDIAVAFCVGRDDMRRLREDEVLGLYADYIG